MRYRLIIWSYLELNWMMSFYTQVGLRWWNYIDENGDSQWMFEKRNGDSVHLLSATEVLYKFN